MLTAPLSDRLGAYRRFASIDVDETRQKVAEVYCPHQLEPLHANSLDAWQNCVSVGSLGIGVMAYGAEVAIDPGCFESFFLLMLPIEGNARITAGTHEFLTDHRTASILSPTEPVQMLWSEECQKAIVRIERDAMEQHLAALLDRPLKQPLVFHQAMDLAGRAGNWWRYMAMLVQEVEECAGPIGGSATIRQLESLLMTSILEVQPNNYSEALKGNGCRAAPRHVRAVERYIDEHAHEAIDMASLVAVSGVSARTLFDGFQRFRDITPMGYLRHVRMHHVHRALAGGEPGRTVAETAARWGFFELGRFAGRYRMMFGESPSDTLRSAQTRQN